MLKIAIIGECWKKGENLTEKSGFEVGRKKLVTARRA
jgi:hypothetical protein